ncbi:hypothetical protein BD560DRAFT_429583 [Blakeslea trispora]|nr:hypothetical protein BD560DRAFT_429583 [Blakeslea trispora]
MAWVGSLPLSLGERLLVNLVMTHSSCIPKGSESVAEGTASKPMRRMNERPKETQKVQKGMDSDSKVVSYTCQKPPDSDSFFLSVDRQKLSDSGGSLTLSFNKESCPYFNTVIHWSDTPRF